MLRMLHFTKLKKCKTNYLHTTIYVICIIVFIRTHFGYQDCTVDLYVVRTLKCDEMIEIELCIHFIMNQSLHHKYLRII